jgi:hypothetical protein
VVENGQEPAPALALVQPQNRPHETAATQAAPVPSDLQAVTRRLEALDDKCRLSGRDVSDYPSHNRMPG